MVRLWLERCFVPSAAPPAWFGSILKGHAMLWTIAVVLIVLWALGLVSAYTMGGFVHVLLVLAVVVLVIQLAQGRKVL